MSIAQLKIGIDCRLAGQRHAGIGRYIENLVNEIFKLSSARDFTWILFFNDPEQAEQVLGAESDRPSNVTVIFTTDIRHYSLREQFLLPHIFAAQNLDLLHIPHFNVPIFYSGKIIVTIHDLLWHEYRGAAVTTLPKWKYWPKYLMYRYTVWQAVRKASAIITPSQTVANQVQKYFPTAKAKIAVTLEGIEQRFFAPSQASTKLQPNTLLYLGSLYPHKNVKVVLEALQHLPYYKLLIVSARNVFQENILQLARELHVENQVEFLGRFSDDQVTQLLHSVTALVQPSLSEGFGLTGLEAMAAGCPVIASDIPIFSEIYQHQAIPFNPRASASFIEAVKKVEKLNRAVYAKQAQQFANQYSWRKMAGETITQYRKLLGIH